MVKTFFKILVCPLDWGIGHATRCVPVIRQLQKENHELILAADGKAFDFFKANFPGNKIIRFKGVSVKYPAGNKMMLKMMLQAPGIFFSIFQEHRKLKKIIEENGIDVVISDNRFGLWSGNVHSIYITHQLMIKAPAGWKWTEPILHRIHRWFIKHYDECWIPDLPGEPNLSGDLSHKYPLPHHAKFIGPQSRFENSIRQLPDQIPDSNRPITQSPDLLALLSGPEPQRSIFENIILKELDKHRGLYAVILQGKPGTFNQSSPAPGVFVFNHLPDEALANLITTSQTIICRSGYSTLMDLVTLGKSAVLVPTPGQTEQEYLAKYLSAKGWFSTMKQDEFELGKAMAGNNISDNISDNINSNDGLLTSIISNFGDLIKNKNKCS